MPKRTQQDPASPNTQRSSTQDKQRRKESHKSVGTVSDENESEMDTFLRILDERGKGRKAEVKLLWSDGTKSWVPRKDVEGQEALEDWDERERPQPEVICSPDELLSKVRMVADLLRTSPRTVWHVGAGASTSAGVPDFRGPNGLWTTEASDISDFDLTSVKPNYAYYALCALERKGFVHHVVTQNYDGLFRKAGFPRSKLSEIHGNIFDERCRECHRTYTRTFPVEKEDSKDHETGRHCACGGDLFDQIVHFGENLMDADTAETRSREATVAVAVGTKLQVTPASTWALWPKQGKRRGKGKVVIVNAQPTSTRDRPDVVIHNYADSFFRELLRELDISINE